MLILKGSESVSQSLLAAVTEPRTGRLMRRRVPSHGPAGWEVRAKALARQVSGEGHSRLTDGRLLPVSSLEVLRGPFHWGTHPLHEASALVTQSP